MVEYYDECTGELGDSGYWASQSRAEPRNNLNDVHHYPLSDPAAKYLIEELGAFNWTTTRTKSYYTSNPYRLYADIDGRKHIIHLPGRHGTTLSWLKEKRGA